MTTSPKAPTAKQIIQNLRNFNRKERDHLMKFALCDDSPPNPAISVALWRLVRSEKATQRPLPRNMSLGMDYHLNWLYAALVATTYNAVDLRNGIANSWSFPGAENDERPILGNQQDVDLLVAWPGSGKKVLNVALVEAKLDSGWVEDQFKSKLDRIKNICREAKNFRINVSWKVLLLSPKKPPRSGIFSKLPREESGISIRYAELPIHKTEKVQRGSNEGKFWKLT